VYCRRGFEPIWPGFKFGWITVIALNLYLVVVRTNDTSKLELLFHGIVWAFTLLCTFIPFASPGTYGFSGLWCWFTWDSGQVFRWVLFYVPLILMIISVAITYILILATVKSRLENASEENREKSEKLIVRLRAYPIIFVCCWIFPIINRIYDATNEYDSFFLYFMHALTDSAFGLLNAIAYSLIDPEMRRLWWEQFAKWGFCKMSGDAVFKGDDVVVDMQKQDRPANLDDDEENSVSFNN